MDEDEIAGIEHRIIPTTNQFNSINKTPDGFKSSLEGLSEREIRILVQDEFTPAGHGKHHALGENIQSGSGLASTTASTPDFPLKVHDGAIASMAAKNPLAPTMSLTNAEQLIRQTKVAATSGDLFMTGKSIEGIFHGKGSMSISDWAVGQAEKKAPATSRSKSEPRNLLSELHDENMLSSHKREMVKKILRLQRQKFKDNQARKSRKSNEFENSIYSFAQLAEFTKDEEGEGLLDE